MGLCRNCIGGDAEPSRQTHQRTVVVVSRWHRIVSDDVDGRTKLLQQAPQRLLHGHYCLYAARCRDFAKSAELQGVTESLLPMNEQGLARDGLAAPFRAHKKSIGQRAGKLLAPLVVAKAGRELAELHFAEA